MYLERLILKQYHLLAFDTSSQFVSQFIMYLGSIATYCMVAPAIFSGSYLQEGLPASEYVSKYVSLLMNLIYNSTQLLTVFTNGVGTILGWFARVNELYKGLDKNARDSSCLRLAHKGPVYCKL